jgi:TPR repeat protein
MAMALITLTGGCGGFACDLMHHSSEVISACKLGPSVFEYEELHEDPGQRNADAERAARERAAPGCSGGDARSCLTIAVYDERHRGSRAAIARAYAVACRGDLGLGCYGAGRFEADASSALALFARGCKLGEAASCEAAATVDRVHETAFHEAACWLNDDEACAVAASHRLYGIDVPVDRVRAWRLAQHGCEHGNASACALQGRIP